MPWDSGGLGTRGREQKPPRGGGVQGSLPGHARAEQSRDRRSCRCGHTGVRHEGRAGLLRSKQGLPEQA